MKTRLFLASFVVLGATFSLHVYAHFEKLYFHMSWIDIPMHFAGGVGVGFLGLWAALMLGLLPIYGSKSASLDGAVISWRNGTQWWGLAFVIIVATVIGLAWETLEVFRLAYLNHPIPKGYIADTTLDLMMDMVGAVAAWKCWYRVQYGTWGASGKFQQTHTQY